MQQNVLSLTSASDVPQIIQFTYCLYIAEWNPDYEYNLSYFITTIIIFLYIFIVLTFLI